MSHVVSPKTHCLDQPWLVYDDLLETILVTPDLSARDGLVMMAVEVGLLCADSETSLTTWFPGTRHLSRTETLAYLRGITIVAQMLPAEAFIREGSPLVPAQMHPAPFSPSEHWQRQTDAMACQAGMVINLQRLTGQVAVFQEVWSEFRGVPFQLPPPQLPVHELGRLEQFPPLAMYQFDISQSVARQGVTFLGPSPVRPPEAAPDVLSAAPVPPARSTSRPLSFG